MTEERLKRLEQVYQNIAPVDRYDFERDGWGVGSAECLELLIESVPALVAEVRALRIRRDELLATVARVSRETPYPDELKGWEAQRRAMVAEVGTLRARVADLGSALAIAQQSYTTVADAVAASSESAADLAGKARATRARAEQAERERDEARALLIRRAAEARAQTRADLAASEAACAQMRAVLVEVRCRLCGDTGTWTSGCSLCGDSSEDHECVERVHACDLKSCLAKRAALAPDAGKALLDRLALLEAVARTVIESHDVIAIEQPVAEGGDWVYKPTGQWVCEGCGNYGDTPGDIEHDDACLRMQALAALGGAHA
jgi:hypothetical protein